ncbi:MULTISPECIES: DUF802 domain-containing protein [unclassified Stenotrophomonas]|uniref:DUF802 domain-containing protein n=1 Tax=unclassified Stenotrophomonas TaxID=196198 RepID=UPI002118E977|nr:MULTISPECIES: DUF802 domain-containing protein [unclassified Stenotrophomonas]
MFRTSLYFVVFLAGLLAACWIGAGYLGSNPVGAAVAAVIVACYCAGALELLRYRQATLGLGRAVADADAAQADLAGWLARVPDGLRNAVRLRVDGERIALPAPVLTPYLVGLLVLLGMLGTLLGMMATLRGTGLALESATDLQAIRGSLGAPVEGLAVAFGTSIAGVATSAMLGLLAALCRRERLQTVQLLDAQIATSLHPHSQGWQRAEAFRMAQAQAELMPALVERLHALTVAIEERSTQTQQQLLDSQERFHAKADAEHARLAAAVELALKDSMAASARAVGESLQPIMQDTMAAIAGDTRALQQHVGAAVEQQLSGLNAGLAANHAANAETWRAALAAQQQSNQQSSEALRAALEQLSTQHDQRAVGLLDALSERMADNVQHWSAAQTAQQQTHQALTAELRDSLAQFTGEHARQASGLADALASRLDATAERWATAQHAQQQANDSLVAALDAALQRLTDQHDARATALVDSLAHRLEQSSGQTAALWRAALDEQQATSSALAERNQTALSAVAGTFDTQAAALVEAMQQSQHTLQDALESRDAQRLAQWSGAFEALTGTLGEQWSQTSAQVAQRQQAICDALASTAQQISAQTQAHASDTIAEISRLVHVASEAPKAAADVVAELRQKLSDSMVRDTAMLDERSRLLATLETLLDAVNHASTEQRTAVDALVTTSADLLERVGSRFTEHLAVETGKLGEVAAQVTGSAVEVASLADAFGGAMQVFGTASADLGQRLEQIGTALDASLARSDEQLAYYVGQAREVIDLSVLSQKQIIEELQQLGARRGTGKAASA